MARKKNYVNNKDFTNALAEWTKKCKTAKAAGNDQRPLIPDYIAECFIKIVTKYGSRRNFSGYTYIQDMKSEALEHCVKYADRFDIQKSQNGFAYFTQVIHNAFIQFLNREKKFAKFKFQLGADSIENAHKFNRNLISSSEDPEKRNEDT